jgi:hypothetical protein
MSINIHCKAIHPTNPKASVGFFLVQTTTDETYQILLGEHTRADRDGISDKWENCDPLVILARYVSYLKSRRLYGAYKEQVAQIKAFHKVGFKIDWSAY